MRTNEGQKIRQEIYEAIRRKLPYVFVGQHFDELIKRKNSCCIVAPRLKVSPDVGLDLIITSSGWNPEEYI